MQLPADLREKIESLIGDGARKSLADAAKSVSLKYRRENNENLQIESELEAKAYIATRFPATWCAATDILHRLHETLPCFTPSSSLDLGAGPGTATSAAQILWPDVESHLLEPNAHLRRLGQDIVKGNWRNENLQSATFGRTYDLTIASYVFNEIHGDINVMLEKIWRATAGAFILIEPGTPQGYEIILQARDYFRETDAHIAAPCPHHFECPLRNTDRWCHFSVRVDRSKLHLDLKDGAVLSYEDEKFSYLVVTRQPVTLPEFRVLGHPHGQKVVRLETCNNDGAFRLREFSKKSPYYKAARKIEWGDALFPETDTPIL